MLLKCQLRVVGHPVYKYVYTFGAFLHTRGTGSEDSRNLHNLLSIRKEGRERESLLYHPRKMRKPRNDRMKNRRYTELPFPTLLGPRRISYTRDFFLKLILRGK